MMNNEILELVNKDSVLLALFSGLLIDGILIIALIFYISILFI